MKIKNYFPMFIDLSDKYIVVVGGGKIATRRVKTLYQFTRNILVVSPKLTRELQDMVKAGQIRWINRKCRRSDLSMAYMVLAVTDDAGVNDDIYRICKEEGIYVNVASDKDKCDFHFPGIVKYDEVVIGVNAGGADHKKVKKVRMEIEEHLMKRGNADES